MNNKTSNLSRFLIILFVAAVFISCLTKVVDTDAWQHLTTGKAIFEHGGIPATEPYIYPSLDRSFPKSSWLFGLISYTVYHFFSVYGLILFKSLTITAAFYFFLKDSLLPARNYVVAIIVMVTTLLISQHRFIIRPDIFLMFFLSFNIFALNAYLYEKKKYLFALPFFSIIWANSHSSINIMPVIFLSFIAGGILQQIMNRVFRRFIFTGQASDHEPDKAQLFPQTPSIAQIIIITLVLLLSFAASTIGPFSTSSTHTIGPISTSTTQYSTGAGTLGSDWWADEIGELAKPTWKTNGWPHLITAAVAISFLLNYITAFLKWFMIWRKNKKGHRLEVRGNVGIDSYRESGVNMMPSLIHLFMVMPFIWLSFTALRFIFLLAIVSGPLIARNLSLFVNNTKSLKELFNMKPAFVLAMILILLSPYLALSNVKPFIRKTNEFGFGFSTVLMPEEALKYMDKKSINGRIFNTFQWGQYITWRDFPERSAFVDGRGALPTALLEKLKIARGSSLVMDELYEKYGFESILIDYMIDDAGVTYLSYETSFSLQHPGWALVYWDDNSLLYLKRGGIYDSVIKEDEYRFVKPNNKIDGARALIHDNDFKEGLITDIKRNIDMTGSSKAYSFLGYIYNETALYTEAIEAFQKVSNVCGRHGDDACSGIAYAYGKLSNFDESIKYYKKVLKNNRSPITLYNIGIIYKEQGDNKEAVKYFSEALKLNRAMVAVYPQLISVYKKLGMTDDAEKTAKMLEEVKALSAGGEHFKKGLKAYFENKHLIAAEEYKKSIKINPSSPEAYSNLGYLYIDINKIEMAFEYQRKAIDIDPDFANAHYGLAMIYVRWGNMKMAKKHFEEYVRLEPGGYYTRRAKEAIRGIK